MPHHSSYQSIAGTVKKDMMKLVLLVTLSLFFLPHLIKKLDAIT
jgi:hypothetical protein